MLITRRFVGTKLMGVSRLGWRQEEMADNSSEVIEVTLSCDLTGLPSFILQFVLGCIAFSTLISK